MARNHFLPLLVTMVRPTAKIPSPIPQKLCTQYTYLIHLGGTFMSVFGAAISDDHGLNDDTPAGIDHLARRLVCEKFFLIFFFSFLIFIFI